MPLFPPSSLPIAERRRPEFRSLETRMALKEAQPRAIKLSEYTPPAFLIDSTELRFDLGDGVTEVTSTLTVRRNPETAERPSELVLDGDELDLVSVELDGEPLSTNAYAVDEASLRIADVPDAFTVRTVTRIRPEENTALEGLYRSGGMYCTQCEAEGFRRITYYLDRPDVMARFRTTIVGDGERLPIMLSNGNEVARETLDDGRTAVTWEDPFPKPAYLFALVAGTLEHIEDRFTTMSGREVTLRIYTEPHNIDKVDYAMDALKRSMKWDEEVYGREYDLDIFMIVAVDDFNMGAMENKGLNVFNTSCVLASQETTTDLGFQRVEAVVAHEYFHNWSGNRVTCRDWFQLSLKEGFTVLRDSQFSADQNSPTIKRIEDASVLRTMGPMAHPIRPDAYIEISNFYTLTVYEKGAAVVGMIRTLLGPEAFRKGSDLYFERHDGQAVTCDDFVQAMEDASGVDLSQFRLWYSQAGTPEVEVVEEWDADESVYRVSFTQSCPATPGQPEKAPFHIPVALGLLAPDGRELLGAGGEANGFSVRVRNGAELSNPAGDGTLVAHLRKPVSTLTFENVPERPVLSVLRDFSAPVKVRFERSLEDLAFLMVHDTDGFSRWDAAQALQTRVLLDLVADPEAEVPEALVEAAGRLLDAAEDAPDDGEAKALLTAMLTLPAEDYVAQQMKTVDVDGIHAARERVRQLLADRFTPQWQTLYVGNAAEGGYSPDAASIARRGLRNLALAYLARSETGGGVELAEAQYRDADNMTDRLSALRTVVWNAEGERADALLEDFLARYRDEALVVDQWFATQALATAPGTLERAKALVDHEMFDGRNPNKIRAVVGAFCNQNPVSFHAADGSGYDFLADWILRLDAQNPQLAARLLTPLTRWKRYDTARQRLMQGALQRILDAEGDRSKDVYEVVSKSLAD
jgi:aminopeptidase N